MQVAFQRLKASHPETHGFNRNSVNHTHTIHEFSHHDDLTKYRMGI